MDWARIVLRFLPGRVTTRLEEEGWICDCLFCVLEVARGEALDAFEEFGEAVGLVRLGRSVDYFTRAITVCAVCVL